MSSTDLRARERELDEREGAIRLAEDELVLEEARLDGMEGRATQRNATIENLFSHLQEQENSLRRRANLMGDSAKDLVANSLEESGLDALKLLDGSAAQEERSMLLERREELLATRAAILEDRQAALAQRQIQIEDSNEQLEAIRTNLLDYEQKLADALRSLIRKSAEWEVMTPSQAKDVLEPQAPIAVEPTPEPEPSPEPETSPEPLQDEITPPAEAPAKKDDFDITFVEAEPAPEASETNPPEVNASSSDLNFISPHSPAEDQATQEREDSAQEDDGEFPITLEIDLTGQDGHAFFRYDDDAPDELPGLFLSTNRRLKEGREVILEMLATTDGRINTKGVVSWGQKEEDGEGPTGMGIDIVDLTPADMALVRIWLETHQMMVV